jgi:hypothetical protein
MATEAPAETAASTARTVKDVNPHAFVKAYSAHLKRSGKVTHPATSDPSLWLIQVVYLLVQPPAFGILAPSRAICL